MIFMTSYNFNVIVKDQTGTAVVGALATMYDSTGATVFTDTTIANGIFAAHVSVPDTNNPKTLVITKTGSTSQTFHIQIDGDETTYYCLLPSYSTTYCTPLQAAKFVFGDTFTFSDITKLTDSTVAEIINMNEDEIDSFLQTSFRTNTITDEFHNIDRAILDDNNFCRFWPKYRPLQTKNASWKIEIFNGNTYDDFVTTKVEGRANDYYIDYNKSAIHLRPTNYGNNALRLTYTWGFSTVPNDIKKLCVLKTALNLLDMDDYVGNVQTGDQQLSTKRDSYLAQIKTLESHLNTIRFT